MQEDDMTTPTMPMLETYPQTTNLERTKLAAVIDALVACSEACTACAQWAVAKAGTVDPAQLLTMQEPITDILGAYRQFQDREPGWLKVAPHV
jgi:threonine dehydrogenase-like Zn-dependent dehydrogenase